jgi:hypothetical protein
MTTFISESLTTDKLAKIIFTKIILFAAGFFNHFFIFVLWQSGQ